jgi:hypothetical protein
MESPIKETYMERLNDEEIRNEIEVIKEKIRELANDPLRDN